MALVKCPECGKENVSDTATSCPDCGYNIKLYYDSYKALLEKEQRVEQEKERNREKHAIAIQALELERDRKISDVDNATVPTVKPTLMSIMFKNQKGSNAGLTYFVLFVLLASLIIFIITESQFFKVVFFISLFGGIPLDFIIANSNYKYACQRYERMSTDLFKYKKEEKERIEKEYNTKISNFENYGQLTVPTPEMIREKEKAENKPLIKCPTCGSTNINNISTVNRTASLFVAGLASSKIGKQFECKDCGYKW